MADFLYDNINLGSSDAEAAALISALGQRTEPTTPTFPNGTDTGDTITAGYFVFVADSATVPVLSGDLAGGGADAFSATAALTLTLGLGTVTQYVFDFTLTRILPAGSARTQILAPFITIEGRNIVLQTFAVDVVA